MKQSYFALFTLLFPSLLIAEPAWVENPNPPGITGASACVETSQAPNRSMQRQMAVTFARRELAQMIEVHVKSSFESITTVQNGQARQAAKDQITLESERLMRGSVVRESWRNPANGTECAWVVLPRPLAKE
jgi:hypothetical protein